MAECRTYHLTPADYLLKSPKYGRQNFMSFTVFILAIAIINLVIGFASASYLGWGPRSWDEIDLALNDPQTVSAPVEAHVRIDLIWTFNA